MTIEQFKEKIHQYLEACTKSSAKPELWLLAFLACEFPTGITGASTQDLALKYAQSRYPHLTAIPLGNILNHLQNLANPPSSLEEVLEGACSQQIERNRRPGPEIHKSVLVEDFKRPFEGKSAVRLHERLRALSEEDEELYAVVLPLIQSSGVGKSRTVVELSKYAPGIIFCIRTTSPSKTSSLPAQDAPIFHFLSQSLPAVIDGGIDDANPKFLSEWWDHCLVAALIIATVETFKEICAQLLEDIGAVGKKPSAEQYKTLVRNFAQICVDDIVDGYRSDSTSPGPDANSTGRRGGRSAPSTSDRSDQQPFSKPLPSRPVVIEQIARRASLYLLKIHPADKPDPTDDPVKFRTDADSVLGGRIREHVGTLSNAFEYYFIALDEFSNFSRLLTPMRRLFSQIKGSSLVALVTDTNNTLDKVAGPVAAEGSDRSRDGSLRLLPPHLIISHDIELSRQDNKTRYYNFITGRVSFTNAEILTFIPLMGRPLWADNNMRFRKTGSLVARVSLDRVFAKMVPGAPNEEDAVIALVASRLPLTILGVQGEFFIRVFRMAMT
jgi:hypothetical protein